MRPLLLVLLALVSGLNPAPSGLDAGLAPAAARNTSGLPESATLKTSSEVCFSVARARRIP